VGVWSTHASQGRIPLANSSGASATRITLYHKGVTTGLPLWSGFAGHSVYLIEHQRVMQCRIVEKQPLIVGPKRRFRPLSAKGIYRRL
jgi:hypothetical protein